VLALAIAGGLGLTILVSPEPALGQNNGFLTTGYVIETSSSFSPIVGRDISTNVYDAHGNLVQSTSQSQEETIDGQISILWRSFTTNTYDRRGNLVQSTSEWPYGNGSNVSRQTSAFENDSRGRPVLELTEYDAEGDGVVDGRGLSSFSYDNNGLTSAIYTWTIPGSTNQNTVRESYAYDNRGNLVTYVHEDDDDLGNFVYRAEYINDYRNNLQYEFAASFSNGTQQYANRSVSTMNEHWLPLSSEGESHEIGGNEMIVTGTATYNYDNAGNLLQLHEDIFVTNSLPGPVHFSTTTTFFYTHRGDLTVDLKHQLTPQMGRPRLWLNAGSVRRPIGVRYPYSSLVLAR
jgi:hypothetical protein